MVLRADRVVITEDQYGFQKATATGGKDGLARMRQKREGVDEYTDGEAERVEYNTNTEVAEFFHRAWVKSGQDQVRGDYIWYDAISEKYLVTAGQNRDPKGPPARVRAVIQPRNKSAQAEQPAAQGQRPELKGSGALASPPRN
jgi:lipopolysaccharide export system protein LptA